ncbi:MAG: hypothetical protein RSB09_04865 [Clostridia bacterium]
MKITECEKKDIKVTCKNGNVFSGFCDEYLSTEESEDNRACIYVNLSPHVCVELFEEEILKIEERKST